MPRMRRAMANRTAILAAKPALLLSPALGMRERSTLREAGAGTTDVPSAQIFHSGASTLLRNGSGITVNGKVPAPAVEKVDLKNVVGVLRGSDPRLRDTYLLITAHYDHVGVSTVGDGDRIRNGANDDASGVAAVLEVAEAIVRSGHKPKRSIVFMCYFGEEKGLFGSRYYAKRPMFPLKRTVANLNLEQLGRVDDPGGDRTNKLTASGFTYTSLGDVLKAQSARVGVEAWNDEKNSEAFFPRSDNQALADAGVPAITLCVAWTFPDYHRPGDHWDKLDYPNLQRVTRAIALTALAVADNEQPPTWVDNGKTTRYMEAAKKLQTP
jgi:Zn-dependent M28 family amino/carboxypeptidase